MRLRLAIAFVTLAAVPGLIMSVQASAAPALQASAGSVLKSVDTDTPGIVAEVIECSRKDGVLSIRVRLRNTSAAPVRMSIIKTRNFDAYYVTAGSKRVLRAA